MKEVQSASLQVLKKVTKICEENKIRYCLTYGTLIGAIRHNGFIPWDDDIDIMMPRPDYEKLLNYFKDNEQDLYPLKLFNMETCKDYPYMISRISDDRYVLKVQNEKDYGIGVFIDIYPIDGVGNSLEEGQELLKKTCKYASLIFLSTRKYYHVGTTKGLMRKIIKFPSFYFAKLLGKDFFVKRLVHLVDTHIYDTSNYVACPIWDNRPYWVFKKDILENLKKHTFEDLEFYIPDDYDSFLRMIYGDYMKLPPERDRIYHHLYTAYKK